MSKKFATMALAAALAATSAIPVAHADPRGHGRGWNNHAGHGYNGGHRGRGHYRNGKWIALRILGAAAAAAVVNSDRGDCYTRRGRRYCD
jgi:opacity protein-like surface antigen